LVSVTILYVSRLDSTRSAEHRLRGARRWPW